MNEPVDAAAEAAASRLRQAIEMYAVGLAMMWQNLKRRHPNESDAQLDSRLEAWLHERPDETEWPHGKVVPWPRPPR